MRVNKTTLTNKSEELINMESKLKKLRKRPLFATDKSEEKRKDALYNLER